MLYFSLIVKGTYHRNAGSSCIPARMAYSASCTGYESLKSLRITQLQEPSLQYICILQPTVLMGGRGAPFMFDVT